MGKCYIGNKEVTCEEWDAARKSRYKDSEKVKTGKSTTGLNVTGQQGSQFWLNTDFTGPEPSKAVKAAASSASYARDWMSGYTKATVKASNAGIIKPVSQAVVNIATTYPEPAAETKKLWQDYPALAPTGKPAPQAGSNVGPGATPGSISPVFQIPADIRYGGGSGGGAAGSTDTGAGDTTTLLLGLAAAGALLWAITRPSGRRA